ncbi:MAG: hypothetical protein QOI76_2274 [Frankiales bacterium]|jgi:hypothetical protein|nr:hypothetical protein [Frankiales bacterium]
MHTKDDLTTACGGLAGLFFGLAAFRPVAASLTHQWVNTLTGAMAGALALLLGLAVRRWAQRLP